MRCTSQRDGCIDCMSFLSLCVPHLDGHFSFQLVLCEKHLALSRIEVRLLKDLVEAIGVKSCWLLVLARPGFVEQSV